MLRELVHVCRHAPEVLALKRKLPQAELYATLIERADTAGLAVQRARLVEGLTGSVVEVGAGTGSMFPFYGDVELEAVEPDPEFAAIARRTAIELADRRARIRVLEGSGEAMPFPDRSMDAAVIALVLCSVPDPGAILREVRRVLKPGGELRLIEHVRSERWLAGKLMHLVDPLWLRLNGQGCHLDRDPIPAIEDAGFAIDRVEPFQIWSAGLPAFPMRLVFASS